MRKLFPENFGVDEMKHAIVSIKQRNNICFIISIVLGVIALVALLAFVTYKLCNKNCCCDEYDLWDDEFDCDCDSDCCASDDDFEKI